MKGPSISAVVRVYNADRYIGEALTAILSQTRPADEVLVIDDGSTDGTPDVLEGFRSEIRVVRQDNRGYAHALNRSFLEARKDFVANCDADDIWEPDKLERQCEALKAHPETDLAFARAEIFGNFKGAWGMPELESPCPAVLNRRRFARVLFQANTICPSSTLIRRELYHRLGPFADSRRINEDYDYWMRALRAGAVFYYDPRTLVHYRRHETNVSCDTLALHRSDYRVRRHNADLVDRRAVVRKALARDLFHIGRDLTDRGSPPHEARSAFLASLRQWPSPRALAWTAILSAPEGPRRVLAERLVLTKRTLLSASRQ